VVLGDSPGCCGTRCGGDCACFWTENYSASSCYCANDCLSSCSDCKEFTFGEGCGDATGSWWRSGIGVGEYVQQRLSLLWERLLREDEGWIVYV
jgi:hypothetical protein